MKKHIKTVIAFAVFAASALAYQASELYVKVPFAFKVGSATLPAGTYTVTESTGGYMLIRGDKGGVFVPRGVVAIGADAAGKPSLKFNQAGDQYVLNAVESEK
jgi:hypothetical protein